MCIFSSKVDRVTDIKIFVAPTADRKRQLVVYENHVDRGNTDGDEPVVMIIPAYNGGNLDSVVVHGMSEDMKGFFEQIDPPYRGRSNGSPRRRTPEADKGGPWKVYVARTLEDVRRAGKDLFKLSENVLDMLVRSYGKDYSFILSVITKDGKTNPLVYSHPTYFSGGYDCMIVPLAQHRGHDESVRRFVHKVYTANANRWVLFDNRLLNMPLKDELQPHVNIPGPSCSPELPKDSYRHLEEVTGVDLGECEDFGLFCADGVYKNHDGHIACLSQHYTGPQRQ